jgi:hypothetical protein
VSQHSDPDLLALRALGEEVPEVEEHLATCARCRDELDQLRAVVTTARAVEPEDQPEAPPPRVWESVVAELGLTGAAGAAAGDELAARRTLAGRRRGSLLFAAAAAVLGIAVGAAGAVLLSGDDGTAPTQVVAQAELAALPEHQGSGSAAVRTTGDRRVLVVDVADLTEGDGFYEVWLLDAEAQRLVSLGLLEGDRGRFQLPDAVDVADFPVVDVSIEPADGDPAHSGNSVVRGTLSS